MLPLSSQWKAFKESWIQSRRSTGSWKSAFLRRLRLAWLLAQPALVFIAVLLISFQVYVFFKHVLVALNISLVSLRGLAITAFGLFLLLNILFNYVMTVIVPPGFSDFIYPASPLPPGLDQEGRNAQGIKVFCVKCSRFKPPRSHHVRVVYFRSPKRFQCSICGRCVLKMDHHVRYLCPFNSSLSSVLGLPIV